VDTAVVVSLAAVVITAIGAILVARITGRYSQSAASTAAAASEAARISADLWRMIEYERKRTEEAEVERDACAEEAGRLRAALEMTSTDRRIDTAQALVLARELAVRWRGERVEHERELANARNLAHGKVAFAQEQERRAQRAEEQAAALAAALRDLERRFRDLERAREALDEELARNRETIATLRRQLRGQNGAWPNSRGEE
jgi:chromosome segregation ATPase